MEPKSWPENRAEIATWLSGYLSMYKKWVDKILDNEHHAISKGKIVDLISEWIKQLEELRTKIIKMKDTEI